MVKLENYRAKRNFTKTSEPEGGTPHSDKMIFVIHKHAATHLHYDFRLEVKGVLKSWAVPRGPSMDPGERRLAVPVEDHPYDYKDFEGIIPKGQYGGGTVIIWDEGWYEPATDETFPDKAAQEHWMTSNYWKNALKITLHGHKLKGDFILIKFKDDKYEGGWRLIKADDQYASKDDILQKNKSVRSKLTIEQMAANKGAALWQSNRKPQTTETNAQDADSLSLLKKKGSRSKMPPSVSPMLCTLTKEPVDNPDYVHELKWDGYRIISRVEDGKVRMHSRSALDYTKKYPPIAMALEKLGHDIVLDGEVVVFNKEGKPDFDALQLYNGHNTPIVYCVFDLLWLDGYDLMNLRLSERKAILEKLLIENDTLRFSASFQNGVELYEKTLKLDLEGVVSKRKDSTYQPGARGSDWLKTPTRKRQEFVVGGWAESDKSRSFRSLLFGAYKADGSLEWIGRSGGGYKEQEMPAILTKLKKLEIDDTPFINKVLDTKGAKIHWVKPELVANFEFATWTKSGRIRKPATFLGFRTDKNSKEVVREVPDSSGVAGQEVITQDPQPQKGDPISESAAKPKLSPVSNWRKVYERPVRSRKIFEINGHTLELTNIEAEPWPGIKKADLILYYHQVAEYILPHLYDRPLSLHIKNDQPTKAGYYIKDMEGQQPEFVDLFQDQRRIPKKGKRKVIDYSVCNNVETLLYLINLGCIDLNPWSARTASPGHPDYISLDLDPADDDFSIVVEVAQHTKAVLDQIKLKAAVKTSGKRGLHIFLPCTGFSNEEAKSLGKSIYQIVHKRIPDLITDVFSKDHREGKLFFDYTLNDYADTLASVYSVRPYVRPTVSTPLDWKEVNSKLDPKSFTMHKVIQRIKKSGDLFKLVLDSKARISNSKKLSKLL